MRRLSHYRIFLNKHLPIFSALIFTVLPAFSFADDLEQWQAERTPRAAAFKAAHPNPDAAITEIKNKTATLLVAYKAEAQSTLDQAPIIWQSTKEPLVLLDDWFAPRMVVVPAGEFTMGAAASKTNPAASPRHRVQFRTPFAVSMFPITVGEYMQFVADAHYQPSTSCITNESGEFKLREGRDWQKPGFTQVVRLSPVSCISYNDATTYAAWLSMKTGQRYRLPTEAEYEYALRAGSTTAYWWGDDGDAACAFANGLDQDASVLKSTAAPFKCHDGFATTSPVGSFKANAFGLFDMAGNVAAWTADCWNETYDHAPIDGTANTKGDCSLHVLRGGSFASVNLGAASRGKDPMAYVGVHHGLRVARSL